mmetsp:Transcript_56564/g.134754  ORF Transcript_56564/g.134754 Transcript_56564/m.134754 type:complete len:99 (+) Transcript_56564:96-392(+)
MRLPTQGTLLGVHASKAQTLCRAWQPRHPGSWFSIMRIVKDVQVTVEEAPLQTSTTSGEGDRRKAATHLTCSSQSAHSDSATSSALVGGGGFASLKTS